ncbi:hypothetical protein FOL46_002802 [Perkinsus olseni]|uniref:Uncharacterized protein n=2 Tax=Perkinsus olseni TaxID=32597 RepID=A0A7J6KPM4_PEROL|nr:hypothetical protein FOL46_002802 [Perkinsus olseni]
MPATSLSSKSLWLRGCCLLLFIYGVQAFTVTSAYPEGCLLPGLGPAEGTKIEELLEGACVFTGKSHRGPDGYDGDFITIRLNSTEPRNDGFVAFNLQIRKSDIREVAVRASGLTSFKFVHEGIYFYPIMAPEGRRVTDRKQTLDPDVVATYFDFPGWLNIFYPDAPWPSWQITTPEYPIKGYLNPNGFYLFGSTTTMSHSLKVTTSQAVSINKTDEGWMFDISFEAKIQDYIGKYPDVNVAGTLAKGVVPV